MKAAKDFGINVTLKGQDRRIDFKKGDEYKGKDVQRARHLYQRGMIVPSNPKKLTDYEKAVIAEASSNPEPAWSVPEGAAEGSDSPDS